MVNIKTGDVVVLKSGSPDMTVNHVVDDRVVVQWFNFHCSNVNSETFHQEQLIIKQ